MNGQVNGKQHQENGTCRLCAQSSLGVDMLLKDNSEIRDIAKMYLAIEFIIGLPTHICYSCCTLLKTWATFMEVFKKNQLAFKSKLASSHDNTPQTQNSEPLLVTPSPAKSSILPLILPKKRKADTELNSPSTSVSSVLASPLGSTDKEVANGSDTDEASECPPEVHEERKSKRARRSQLVKPVPLLGQPIRPPSNLTARHLISSPPIVYPQQQPPRFLPPAPFLHPMMVQQQAFQQNAALFQQQHQLLPTNLQEAFYQARFLQPQMVDERMVLQSFMSSIPPHQHSNFLAHYINNLLAMNTSGENQQPRANGQHPGFGN